MTQDEERVRKSTFRCPKVLRFLFICRVFFWGGEYRIVSFFLCPSFFFQFRGDENEEGNLCSITFLASPCGKTERKETLFWVLGFHCFPTTIDTSAANCFNFHPKKLLAIKGDFSS